MSADGDGSGNIASARTVGVWVSVRYPTLNDPEVTAGLSVFGPQRQRPLGLRDRFLALPLTREGRPEVVVGLAVCRLGGNGPAQLLPRLREPAGGRQGDGAALVRQRGVRQPGQG